MVIAKRDILTLWKGVEVPSFNAWLAELTNLLQMERIRYDVTKILKYLKKCGYRFLLILQ